MRQKISLVLVTLFALCGLAAFAPSAHAAASAPVEVKRDQCGNINVYENGHPLFEYVSYWCGPSPS
jgi:hypothetical protein